MIPFTDREIQSAYRQNKSASRGDDHVKSQAVSGMGRIYGKKDSVSLRESDRERKMLLQLYRKIIVSYLTPDQLITLEILVWLVQSYKQIKIERLAAYLPLPIKYESRRRRLQRFLKLPGLSISLIWLPIIKNQISMGVYWKSAPPALRFPQRIGRSKKKISRDGRTRTLVLTNEFTQFSGGS